MSCSRRPIGNTKHVPTDDLAEYLVSCVSVMDSVIILPSWNTRNTTKIGRAAEARLQVAPKEQQPIKTGKMLEI